MIYMSGSMSYVSVYIVSLVVCPPATLSLLHHMALPPRTPVLGLLDPYIGQSIQSLCSASRAVAWAMYLALRHTMRAICRVEPVQPL